MITFTIILIVLSFLFNALLLLSISGQRDFIKNNFSKAEEIKRKDIKILYNLSNNDPILREYVTYNAPIFVYPFAARIISKNTGLLQIIFIVLLVFFIFKFNLLLVLICGVMAYLNGYSGSRFNNKLMFEEAVSNFTEKVAPFDKSYFHQKLSDFHENYYQELSK